MKTKILTMLVLLAIAVVSCQKDEADKAVVLQDVTFDIEHVDPFGLKSDTFDIECPGDLTPVKARIKINGTYYEPLVYFLNTRYYTQSIKLAPGVYNIEEFYLLDANDSIVMATPAAGSDYAPYVEFNTVTKQITVEAFVKKEIKMWVLCYEPARYEPFGFFWFRINRIVVWEKCFFGDLCIKALSDYVGSLYELQPGGLMLDMAAIFQIRAFKTSVDPANELPNSPFSNAEGPNYAVGAPVCVEWADNIDIPNEVFIFQLWIYVAVEDGFDFVHFYTWTFVDDQMVGFNGDQVIDFMLGNCGYGGTPPFLLLPPYMNLPQYVTVVPLYPGDPGYFDLNISNPFPGLGNYDLPIQNDVTGWCADQTVFITPLVPYTMYCYSSLYDEDWPANMPWTKQDIATVNWLFNHLGSFSGFSPLTPPYITSADLTQAQGVVIQDAIWALLQNLNVSGMSETMAIAAASHTNYTPLPGGWAAIILVTDDDPDEAQLLFTVVDP
jgi:hypothetical protein